MKIILIANILTKSKSITIAIILYVKKNLKFICFSKISKFYFLTNLI